MASSSNFHQYQESEKGNLIVFTCFRGQKKDQEKKYKKRHRIMHQPPKHISLIGLNKIELEFLWVNFVLGRSGDINGIN